MRHACVAVVITTMVLVAGATEGPKSAYDAVFALKSAEADEIHIWSSRPATNDTDSTPISCTSPALEDSAATGDTPTPRYICLQGQFDTGKTFLANAIFGNGKLRSGTDSSTVGGSVAITDTSAVVDFAGRGLAAHTGEGRRLTDGAEAVLDDVAAQLSCLPVIVISKVNAESTKYVDRTIDRMVQTRSRVLSRENERSGETATLPDIDVVVVYNSRAAREEDEMQQNIHSLDLPLQESRDSKSLAAANVEDGKTNLQKQLLASSGHQQTFRWRGATTVKMTTWYLGDASTDLGKLLLANVVLKVKEAAPTVERTTILPGVRNALRESLRDHFGSTDLELTDSCQPALVGKKLPMQKGDSIEGEAPPKTRYLQRARDLMALLPGLVWDLRGMVWGGESSKEKAPEADQAANDQVADDQAAKSTTEGDEEKYHSTLTVTNRDKSKGKSWFFDYGLHRNTDQSEVIQMHGPGCGPLTTNITLHSSKVVDVDCSLPRSSVPRSSTVLRLPYGEGRARWSHYMYQSSPKVLCPYETNFNNGLIELVFRYPEDCASRPSLLKTLFLPGIGGVQYYSTREMKTHHGRLTIYWQEALSIGSLLSDSEATAALVVSSLVLCTLMWQTVGFVWRQRTARREAELRAAAAEAAARPRE